MPMPDDKTIADVLRKRIKASRRFPSNTCGASRHVERAAEALVSGEWYSMFDDEPAYIGISMLSVVCSLYEARDELARLKAPASPPRPEETTEAPIPRRL